MNQINDTVRDTLEKEGYTGTISDMLSAWLLSTGATGDNINDLWKSYFDTNLIPAGQFNNRMFTWLKSESAVGKSLNDLKLDYWQKRLAFP